MNLLAMKKNQESPIDFRDLIEVQRFLLNAVDSC